MAVMKKKKKEKIFLLTGEQWLGVLTLGVLALGTMFAIKYLQPTEETTVVVSDSAKTAFEQHQTQQDKKYQRDTIEIRLHEFNPNTADSSTLVHVGLKKWQASNMLKYRAKGGRYRRAEDMKKIYGMTDSMYQALLPYIQIDTLAVRLFRDSLYRAQRPRVSPVRADSDTLARDTTPRYISHKRDTVLNLRTADTTELKMIRGIGAYRAKQIVRYREQLGGFASVEQLREVKALQPLLSDSLSADSLLGHFVLDSVKVAPLQVNMAHVESLQRHPYLSFEQAKAIYEYRRKRIRIKSADELKKIKELKEEDIEKLLIYLDFS